MWGEHPVQANHIQKDHRLEAFLDEQTLDGILMVGESFCDPDLYYLTRFLSTGRYAVLAACGITLLVPGMERGRAELESSSDAVESTSDYGIMKKLEDLGKADLAYIEVLKEFLMSHGIRRLGMPGNAPAWIYKYLSKSFETSLVESPFTEWRAIKAPDEIEAIRSTARAGEEALDVAVRMIEESRIEGSGLVLDGRPLTSERVRAAIDISLLENGCESVDNIVCGGPASADPHARGTGTLPADSPIVIDIFPRSKTSRYFADMTRTVLRGRATPELKRIYEAVEAAHTAGTDAISDGVTGAQVHATVCRIFEQMGYPEREDRGFIHSTGHGVGLEVHERPSLGPSGGRLMAGNVVTVEPGLYYREIGGVRIEDLLIVTNSGCENLTGYEKRFIL